jgi:hypothetical protein
VAVSAPLPEERLRLSLWPAMHPHQPVRARYSLGLLVANATELDGIAAALGLTSIDGRADGLLLSFAANVVGGDLSGVAWTHGANVISGHSRAVALSTAVNWAGGDVDVAQLGFAFNLGKGALRGAQLAGGFNWAGGDVAGAQLGGGFNLAGGFMRGVQLSGGFNHAGGEVRGVQLTGGFNSAGGLSGLQVAAINVAGDVRGAQVGVINVAKTVRGTQVGVLNIAEDVIGLPVGPFNWVAKGDKYLDYWASPQELVNLDFRFGSRYVYTLLMGGFESREEPQRWYLALGLGATLPFAPFALHADLSAGPSRKGFNLRPQRNVRGQLRVFLSWEIFSHLGVFAGGSLNTFVGWQGDDIEIRGVPQIMHAEYEDTERFWPSFFGGVQI